MLNEEIDIRLEKLAGYIPVHEKKIRSTTELGKIGVELELLNMSMMAVFTMLGEIAKRLPEKKEVWREG